MSLNLFSHPTSLGTSTATYYSVGNYTGLNHKSGAKSKTSGVGILPTLCSIDPLGRIMCGSSHTRGSKLRSIGASGPTAFLAWKMATDLGRVTAGIQYRSTRETLTHR